MKTKIELIREGETVRVLATFEGIGATEAAAIVSMLTRLEGGQHARRTGSGPDNRNRLKVDLGGFLAWLRVVGPVHKAELKGRACERFAIGKSKFYALFREAARKRFISQGSDKRWSVADIGAG